MKKNYKKLLTFVIMLLCSINMYAVTFTVTVLPSVGSTSGNGRAPQGTRLFINTIYFISAAELTSTGFVGQTVTHVGYVWNLPAGAGPPVAQDIATTGTLKVYMQNTTDASALLSKPGTNFTADLVGMTKVLDGTITIPAGIGQITIDVPTGGPGTTPFSTVSGQGVYIAFEYNTTTTLATPVGAPTVSCNTALASSLRTGQSQISYAAANVLAAASGFRPETRLSYDQPANDIAVGTLYTLGQLPNVFTTNHKMSVRIKNTGVNAQTNVPVTLNITGANTFSDTQTIPSIAPGVDTLITFAGFTPTTVGTDTVMVSVPSDDIIGNNNTILEQPITSNFYSYKYNSSALNPTGVGFNLSPYQAVFVSKFKTSTPALINEVRINFATSATSPRYFRVILFPDSVGKPGSPSKVASYMSAQQTITSVASQQFIGISPPVSVSGNFYVGVSQDSANTGNFGYAYQPESPVRDSTFYFGEFQSGGMTDPEWTDFLDGGPANFRSAVEVQLYIPSPPNCAIDLLPSTGSVICPINPVVLTWTSGGNGPTSYDVFYSTVQSDVDNQLPAALAANVVGTSYSVGFPAVGPTYYWKIVAKNADGSATGCTTQSFTVGTLFSCYCIPDHSAVGCGNGNITNVTFNTLNNTTTCSAPAYTVFPGTGLTTTTVNNGLTYNLSVTTDSICIVSVWIDWNQNGIFETTEWNQVSVVSVPNVANTISILVPVNAVAGQTGMRIRSRFSGNVNGDVDACTPMGSGEAEDYIITVTQCSGTPDPGNTVAASSGVCPGSMANLSLQNAQAPLGINYQWQSAPSSTGAWSNVGGNTNSLTIAQSAATWYQCVVTCSVSGLTAISTPVEVALNPIPTPEIVEGDSIVCSSSLGYYIHVKDVGAYSGGYPPGTSFEWVNYTPPTSGLDSLFVNLTDNYSCIVYLPGNIGGCPDTSNIIFIDFSSSQSPLPSMSQTMVKCNGGSDGEAIATIISGNVAGYNYQWFNSSNVLVRNVTNNLEADTLKNIPVGWYTVTVYNGLGSTQISCVAIDSIEVTEPNILVATGTVTNVKCKGANDGIIQMNPTGGTSPYSYLWNNGSTNVTRNNLKPGVYSVVVTDANGCTATASFTITQPATALLINLNKTNLRCANLASGSIIATPSGGIPGYSYLWNTGSTSNTITNLTAGTYTVVVTDANGCVKTISTTLTQNPALVVVITNGFGSATAGVAGGVPPYTYQWNTVPNQTNATATGLLNCITYKVKVTDSKNCTKLVSTTIPCPKAASLQSTEPSVEVFPNPSTGLISLQAFNFSSQNIAVKLFDVVGKVVYSNESLFINNNVNIDFSTLPKGVYSMSILIGDKQQQIKVVLQ